MGLKEIIEGNKIIAEFMGGKYDKDTTFPIHPDDIWLPVHGIVNATNIGYGRGRTILYHSSWDWLIPCIGKISHQCEEPEELDNLKYALLCDDINTAWKFVVDYLKNK